MFDNVSSHSTKLDQVSVHKKIVFTCFFVAVLFFIESATIMVGMFFLVAIVYIVVGRINFLKAGIYSLKITLPFLAVLAFWHLYTNNLNQGINLVFRLLTAMLIANLFLFTSKIHDIISEIQNYASHLKVLGINPHAVAITFGLFIRSIPILNQRAKYLMLAQLARSTKRSFWRVSMPLVLSIFDDAEYVSEALRARGGIKSKGE